MVPHIVRCLRRDKMTEAMQAFVVDVMGASFVEPPTFDLKACYEDSSVVMPLIFVLSTGSDPNKVQAAHCLVQPTANIGKKSHIRYLSCSFPIEIWRPLVEVRAHVFDGVSPLITYSLEISLLTIVLALLAISIDERVPISQEYSVPIVHPSAFV